MSDKEQAKIEKKLAKAVVKEEKARAKASQPHTAKPVNVAPSSTSPTPAERSAAAAERQVRLQSYRVWFAALGVIIAIATLLITLKPWR